MTETDTAQWELLLIEQGRQDEVARLREVAARRRQAALSEAMRVDNVWHVQHAARRRRDRRVAWLAWAIALAAGWVSWETARQDMVAPFALAALATVVVFAWRSSGRIHQEEAHAERCPRQGGRP